MTNIHAQELGRIGGKSKSPRKVKTAKQNIARARLKRWSKKNKK